ncbi:MAG: ATP-binding protein, partial [Actinobacteria bacterium]|nr:ATP-binding protein [Actinomycetota bacterium]
LGPLTVLVGPNGSGKSNLLDTLRFTADALSTTLDHALRDRGGVNEVRRRSGGHPNHFSMRFDFTLPDGLTGHLAYKVGATRDGGFRVTDEECVVASSALDEPDVSYRVSHGDMKTTTDVRLPPASADRLYLVSAGSIKPFRAVFDALTSMGFYNLNPAAIRTLQQPDPGTLLRRDGGNLASVLGQLEKGSSGTVERVTEYLQRVAPGVVGVTRRSIGSMETLEFRQQLAGQAKSWRFPATNMSDGTLRGLGVLVALLQANGQPPSLVGIEEPEVALHPAAVGILLDAIRDATLHTQVIVTSHSPDLLDRKDISDESILAVLADGGVTAIGPLDESVRSSLHEQLFTAGELLRMNQLEPSEEAIHDVDKNQLRFFDT